MVTSTRIHLRGIFFISLFVVSTTRAAEWSIESEVKSSVEIDDNIFVTSLPHETVAGLIVTPSIKMLARERNWTTFLNTSLRSNNYSDHGLNSNDVYFDLTAERSAERNAYSLNGTLDFDTNLSTESSDFGVATQRVKREVKSLTPQFTRMVTERLLFSASLSHFDAEYVDSVNTGFVSYNTNNASGSLLYDITESDQVSFIMQASAYESKDGTLENNVVVTRLGMNHKISESFSVNYLVGSSQSDSTSRSSQTFIFFGQPITVKRDAESSDTGLVLDAGFEKKWIASWLTGKVSQDETTDSFGSLNQVIRSELKYRQKMSEVWDYSITGRYEDIEAINASNQFANREIFFLKSVINYSPANDWSVRASYRYVKRKFLTQTDDQAPYSNLLSVEVIYNFPSISTF